MSAIYPPSLKTLADVHGSSLTNRRVPMFDNATGKFEGFPTSPLLVVQYDDVVAWTVERGNISYTSDMFQWKDYDGSFIGGMDSRGTFLVGPNPSYRLNPKQPSTWAAVDLVISRASLRDGGGGRLNIRSSTASMINDPADYNGRRAQGSPSGNMVIEHETYQVGTVTAAVGNDVITGAGTLWLADVRVGDSIFVGNDAQTRTVSQVISNTSLRMNSAYAGTAGSGLTYVVNGTVDVIAATDTVVGHNTRWLSQNLENRIFRITGGPGYRIVDVPDDNTLIIDPPYLETTNSDLPFELGFTGYPYGQNFDGTGLYECKNGTVLLTSDASAYTPAGNYAGGSMRWGMHCEDDPFQHKLVATLASAWHPGDTKITLNENPAAIHIVQPNTRGEDQGTYPLRPHGPVTIALDSGKGATVNYSAWDSASKTLLGCTDSAPAGASAAAGKGVTQVRAQYPGGFTFSPTGMGGARSERTWAMYPDGGVAQGARAQASGHLAWYHISGGALLFEKLPGPSLPAYSFIGTSPGTKRRNYYIIQKNGKSTDPYHDIADPLKLNVPDGITTYDLNSSLKITWGVGTGWNYADVVWTDAEADGTDTPGAAYRSIAEDWPLLDGNNSLRGVAVDHGQVINANYTFPLRGDSADARIGGHLRVDGGRSFGTRRVTTAAGDGKVPGQLITITGDDGTVLLSTAFGEVYVYMPSSSSRSGREVEIADDTGGAGTNNIVIYPNGNKSVTVGSHSLPVATLNVGSATSFSGSGTVYVGGQTLTFTGKTGTTLTGVAGGTGTIPAGSVVIQPTDTFNGSSVPYRITKTRGAARFTSNGVGGFRVTGTGPVPITQEDLDLAQQGANWKQPAADLATTAQVTLSGIRTVDGVATAVNRVLVKNQTNPAENGLYTSNTGGAWTRTADADTGSELLGAIVVVAGGATQANSGWRQGTTGTITLGTTAINFTKIFDLNDLQAGAGLVRTGNIMDVGAGNGILTAADAISLDFGTGVNQVRRGNDAAFTDTRTPTDATVTLAKLAASVIANGLSGGTAGAGQAALRKLGTGADDAAAGNDSRIPTQSENDALAGTSGTPDSGNPYVTRADRDTNLHGRYRIIKRTTPRAIASVVTAGGVYLVTENGAIAINSAPGNVLVLPLDVADEITVSGMTPKLRLVASASVNGTAPGNGVTIGLHLVGTPTGSAAAWVPNEGTVVAGTTIGFSSAELSAGAKVAAKSSGDFNFPTAGLYVIGFNWAGLMSSPNSACVFPIRLEVHHV